MKHSLFLLTALSVFAVTQNGHCANAHVYANTISAHNIAMFQHTITQSAISAFGGSMNATLMSGLEKSTLPTIPQSTEDPHKTYGHAPMYGTAPMYGEYNDDGRAGRSGGDYLNADATLNGIWLNWQHMNEDVKFDDFERLTSKSDIFMSGLAGGQSEFAGGLSKWGIYTGYIDASQETQDFQLTETGGFFGVFNGTTFGNLGLFSTINGGVMDNSADTEFGTDGYTNFWVGGAINAAYNWHLDKTFALQPSMHLGYTWIKSENYTSASGDIISNDAFSMIELTPTLRAIKHIGHGWFGALNAKYVIIFDNGGDISVNRAELDTLDSGNFMEYSISLEKSVANFNMSASFGRRDGMRDGWIGGLNIKYLF